MQDSGTLEDADAANAGRCRGSGKLDNPSDGAAERGKVRGNPEFHPWHSRKMRDAGKPEAFIDRRFWGAKTRGNPRLHRQYR
jgi:hypothetical protein